MENLRPAADICGDSRDVLARQGFWIVEIAVLQRSGVEILAQEALKERLLPINIENQVSKKPDLTAPSASRP
jgi:hypothetical protein